MKPTSKKKKPKENRQTDCRTETAVLSSKKHRLLLLLSLILLAVLLVGILTIVIANALFKASVADRLHTLEDFSQTERYDCIIVLGCGVKKDGRPSDMLYDRIKTACTLYLDGKADKILFSGDHGQEDYDEVNTMKTVAHEEFGVPLDDIFLDHAGFSTYETMARAKEVFGVSKAIVVTQDYHLYRALYLAESFSIDADGVSASLRSYAGQSMRDLREVAARLKDILSALFKPDFVKGDPIDITGSGTVTHD